MPVQSQSSEEPADLNDDITGFDAGAGLPNAASQRNVARTQQTAKYIPILDNNGEFRDWSFHDN